MSLSNPINPPLVNEAVAKSVSTGVVFAVDENQTKVNQIHGITPNNAVGAGIPKQVTNVQVSIANASKGVTCTISVLYKSDPSDQALSGVNIWVKGYQGNGNPVQVGSGTSSPTKIVLNNTGETVTFIVQAFGNGGNAPFSQSPVCSGTLPKSTGGGFGSSSTNYVNTPQVFPSTSIVSGSAAQVAGGGAGPATFALNLTTEGVVDWIAQSGQNTSSQSALETPLGWNWKLNGTSRGRFRVFSVNPNESPNALNVANQTTSPLLLSVSAGDPRISFVANPQRNCTYFAPQVAATLGVGTGIEIFGDGKAHTYKIYCLLTRKLTCQVTAHASDGTTADVTLTATESVNQGAIYSFSFNCNIALGNSVVFQAVCTATNGGDTFGAVGIQAVTVF